MVGAIDGELRIIIGLQRAIQIDAVAAGHDIRNFNRLTKVAAPSKERTT